MGAGNERACGGLERHMVPPMLQSRQVEEHMRESQGRSGVSLPVPRAPEGWTPAPERPQRTKDMETAPDTSPTEPRSSPTKPRPQMGTIFGKSGA